MVNKETGEVIDDHYTPAEKKRLEKLDREALKQVERQKRDGTYYRSRSSDNSNTSSGDNHSLGGQISDAGGGALGTIDSDGTIRADGTPVARVYDHTISDARGYTQAVIDHSNGLITSSGTIIGRVDGGEVSNIRGDFIGAVDSNGKITDNSGMPIGSVPAGDTDAGVAFLLHRDCQMHNNC